MYEKREEKNSILVKKKSHSSIINVMKKKTYIFFFSHAPKMQTGPDVKIFVQIFGKVFKGKKERKKLYIGKKSFKYR